MKEYVPAVVFSLYDGYYLYSPFNNRLTTVIGDDGKPELKWNNNYGPDTQNVDSEYMDGKQLEGLTPYVYYTCRYSINSNNDFSITYTLDNYITVQGIVDGNYVYKYGYLIKGITPSGGYTHEYIDGVRSYKEYRISCGGDILNFKNDECEILEEFVGQKKYKYVKINGTKYYLENDGSGNDLEYSFENNNLIFYIDKGGEKNYSQFNSDPIYKKRIYNAIKNGNRGAYEYYRDAYNFTKWVNESVLGTLTTDNAQILSISNDNMEKITPITTPGEIFGSSVDYESSLSGFNQHRKDIIRNVVETSLSASISGFADKVGTGAAVTEFIMPRVSEEDWELIQNNVCVIGFMQGFNIGGRKYNGYAVIPNSLTKEYVGENDIYIIKGDSDNTYAKANDETLLTTDGIKNEEKNGSTTTAVNGIWKLDFEIKKALNSEKSHIYYVPYNGENTKGSYTSIMGSSGLKNTSLGAEADRKDMYDYIDNCDNRTLKRIYYKALARERRGAYHVNNNLDLKYFLTEVYND